MTAVCIYMYLHPSDNNIPDNVDNAIILNKLFSHHNTFSDVLYVLVMTQYKVNSVNHYRCIRWPILTSIGLIHTSIVFAGFVKLLSHSFSDFSNC